MKYLINILLLFILTLTATTTFASPLSEEKLFYKRYHQLSYGIPETLSFYDWLQFIKSYSIKRGISPYRALAVFETESSKPDHGRALTFGPINQKGKFIGPGGLNKKCKKDLHWRNRILDPYFNAEVSINAMTRFKSFKASMKKYNTSFDSAYYNRIMELERINRKAKIFDNLHLVYNHK